MIEGEAEMLGNTWSQGNSWKPSQLALLRGGPML